MFFLTILFLSSCATNTKHETIARRTVKIFQENEILYPANCSIRLLRKSSKIIEYQLKVKDRPGYKIFQTHPEQKILKNTIDYPLSILSVNQFASLNEGIKQVVQSLDIRSEKVILIIKNEDIVLHLYKGYPTDDNKILNKDTKIEIENTWFYTLSDPIPENRNPN